MIIKVASYCWLCRQPLSLPSHGLCSLCLRHLPVLPPCCLSCGLPSTAINLLCGRCLRQPPYWHSMTFVGDYRPPFSTWVQQLKFNKTPELAPLLARLLLLKWLAVYYDGMVCKPDSIICVPLHRRRCWQRGFNQADLISRPLARWLGCAYRHDTLQRLRATPTQRLLSAAARRRNLRSVFYLPHSLAGQHVALLDDVVTTTSTVTEISKLLLMQGVASVQVWCICRTL